MEYPKSSFDTKNEPKYVNGAEAKSEVKKSILAARVRQYIKIEEVLVLSIKKSMHHMGSVYPSTIVSFEGK